VAYDSKDRIEVIIDRKSGVDIDVERLNSYRGQLGAYRRRAGAPSAGPRLSIGRLSDYALSTDLSGFRRVFLPAEDRLGDTAASRSRRRES